MTFQPSPGATRLLFEAALATTESLLPDTWTVDKNGLSNTGGTVRVTAPDGTGAQVILLVRDRLTPREARALPDPNKPTIVVAPWLSPSAREILEEREFGYIDQSGNVHLVLNRPGLAIRTQGAVRNPHRAFESGFPKRPGLRGPRAWALLRTLAEVRPPYGVTDLSESLGTDPGYVSRLLSVLSEDLLIDRVPRGPVRQVKWESILRQMATTYALFDANDITHWMAGMGPEQFLRDLRVSEEKRWTITGSFSASTLVSVTAPAVAVVYTKDPERLADITRLRRVRIGGNVILARPYSRIVFERSWRRDNLVNASLAQVVVDCLTGPARMPSEGEALLDWMRYNAPLWQAPTLTIQADIP